MSLLSRMSAPSAAGDLAAQVTAILANLDPAAPGDLVGPAGEAAADAPVATPETPDQGFVFGPTGLGTATARAFLHDGSALLAGADAARTSALPASAGRDVSALIPREESAGDGAMPAIFCPGAVRDDPVLGETVNELLVDWAAKVGIYPGRLDDVRAANFGRMMMLTHPATDDPDRLLAAAKCVLAEWATDDHFLDEESLGADARTIGWRLGVTYAAVDPSDLPSGYATQLDDVLAEEPVAVAYQSAFEHLGLYASPTQVARLRHELAVMFMAYNHEATWRTTGRIPPVWEYLTHRSENSFLPPMVLVDPMAGYEVPAFEFADRRVRRLFAIAGTATVILNDVYSMSKESDDDFDLPKLIAAEEGCSRQEAIERTVCIHNELMHTFVDEAIVLSQLGSPALRRFLTDIWAWVGGSREWHATTPRYRAVSNA